MENRYKVIIGGDLDFVQARDNQDIVYDGWWTGRDRTKQDFMEQAHIILTRQPWSNPWDVAIAEAIWSFVTDAEWTLFALENM